MSSNPFRLAGACLALLALVTVSACAPTAPSATPSANPSAPRQMLVSLGDSLSASPPHDCDGCTSFLDRFAAQLSSQAGAAVVTAHDAEDDSQLADVASRIQQTAVIADLARADTVVVWIGYNDGPPYNLDTPCAIDPGDTAEQQAAAVEAYTTECLDATMQLYRERYSALFSRITEMSPKATTRLAVATFDNWRGNPAFAGTAFPATRMDPLLEKVTGIFDTWNTMQCAAATASGFRCADVYHRLNGADGRSALADFVSDDYTHLSQKGHDAAAEVLIAAAAAG